MDHLTPSERSANMANIPSRGTRPEIRVRRLLFRMGFRFRLHRSDLPGTPDIVLPKHRACIMVHGCYWHRHEGCRRGSSMPSTNIEKWRKKFATNVARDAAARDALTDAGWRCLVIWECETKPSLERALELRMSEFLVEKSTDLDLPIS